MRVLATPLFLRVGLPSLAIAYGFVGLTYAVTAFLVPTVDTNRWSFIAPTVLAMFVVGAVAWAFAQVMFVRWLISYRSTRHNRLVALGDVLRPSDAAPSRWRLLILRAYGVSHADRQWFLASIHPGGVA